MRGLLNHLLTLVAGAGLIAADVGLRAALGLSALGVWWTILLVLGVALVVLAIGWWIVDVFRWLRNGSWHRWFQYRLHVTIERPTTAVVHDAVAANAETKTAPRSERAEIEGLIWGISGRFNDMPLTRGDYLYLVGVLEHYRHAPWIADPAVEICRQDEAVLRNWGWAPPAEGEEPLWGLSIGAPKYPFSFGQVIKNARPEPLELIRKILAEELVPMMKHWDAWHAHN